MLNILLIPKLSWTTPPRLLSKLPILDRFRRCIHRQIILMRRISLKWIQCSALSKLNLRLAILITFIYFSGIVFCSWWPILLSSFLAHSISKYEFNFGILVSLSLMHHMRNSSFTDHEIGFHIGIWISFCIVVATSNSWLF